MSEPGPGAADARDMLIAIKRDAQGDVVMQLANEVMPRDVVLIAQGMLQQVCLILAAANGDCQCGTCQGLADDLRAACLLIERGLAGGTLQ